MRKLLGKQQLLILKQQSTKKDIFLGDLLNESNIVGMKKISRSKN